MTDDREIRRINREHLKHDYATDVISFWVAPDDPARIETGALGDLVVSVDTARAYAKRIGISFKEELARYLVHGTLHLLGYDDHKKNDHKRMHARQEWILKKIL